LSDAAGGLFATSSTARSKRCQASGRNSISRVGFAMPNPWDRPSIPPSGDVHEDITFRAVGRFLSQWEEVETELSHLYANFVGKPHLREAYEEYYDKSKTSVMRIKTLEESASRFFTTRPSQDDEGQFSNITKHVYGFAERRHEIAHGTVRKYRAYAWLTEWSDPYEMETDSTCLVPPYYQRNWFGGPFKLPVYVYVASQIDQLTHRIGNLRGLVVAFRNRLFPEPWR
jgi:hypothetical protein